MQDYQKYFTTMPKKTHFVDEFSYDPVTFCMESLWPPCESCLQCVKTLTMHFPNRYYLYSIKMPPKKRLSDHVVASQQKKKRLEEIKKKKLEQSSSLADALLYFQDRK